MVEMSDGSSRDLIIHPGETLKEALIDRKVSQKELAKRVDMTEQHVSRVINGVTKISANFAKKIEYALGIPASFWMNLQTNYDLELAEYEDKHGISEAEYEILARTSEVLKDILTLKEQVSETDKAFMVMQARRMFNLASLENIPNQPYAALYRTSKTTDIDQYVAFAWHKLCDYHLDKIPIPKPYDKEQFSGKILDIKSLMFEKNINKGISSLQKLFWELGIRFVVVQHHRGAPVHGMVRLTKDRTIDLALTIRGSRADIFWFSLFHELAHILNEDFLTEGSTHDEATEIRADELAGDLLISKASYRDFIAKKTFDAQAIRELAEMNSIPWYMVVGRLQKEGYISWKRYSKKLPYLKWKKKNSNHKGI